MKSTEERIEQLEKELQALKEETKRHSGKETEYEVGDWIIVEPSNWLIRITNFSDRSVKGYGFHMCDGSFGADGWMCYKSEIHRKAKPEEVEKALRKEWARRCKEAGWDNPDKAKIEAHADGFGYDVNINSNYYADLGHGYSYYPDKDKLWNTSGCIYHNGKWATPKKKAKTFFDWEVKESSETIDIGCERYSKEFLRNVYEALANLPDDATVKNVMKELRKLDL